MFLNGMITQILNPSGKSIKLAAMILVHVEVVKNLKNAVYTEPSTH
jgi:hypothetical protein